MSVDSDRQAGRIVDSVLEVLEVEGYDAVQVRTIAARSRTSMATIYKLFGSRDGLIVAAVTKWMEEQAYAEVLPPFPGESGVDATVRAIHELFAPWERHPAMLEAFFRAEMAPGGDSLELQGLLAFASFGEALACGADPDFIEDVRMIAGHVAHSAITMFVAGSIGVEDIVPALERTLRRLARGRKVEPGTTETPRLDRHSPTP